MKIPSQHAAWAPTQALVSRPPSVLVTAPPVPVTAAVPSPAPSLAPSLAPRPPRGPRDPAPLNPAAIPPVAIGASREERVSAMLACASALRGLHIEVASQRAAGAQA